VLFVPDLGFRLLSVRRLAQKGVGSNLKTEDEAIGTDKYVLVFTAFLNDGLYFVHDANAQITRIVHVASHDGFEGVALRTVWHERFGHLHDNALRQIPGLEKEKVEKEVGCEACFKGKMVRKGFHKTSERKSKQPLELIHSDVDKISPASIGKAVYFVTFLDNYSNFLTVRFLTHKNEVFDSFTSSKAEVENQFNLKIKKFQSDCGTEYCNQAFKGEFVKSGILHRRSVPGCPEQNGKAERVNRTVSEMARYMLLHAGLPLRFWAQAVSTACNIRNRCPSKAIGWQQ